jgi:PDZ domain-containing protein
VVLLAVGGTVAGWPTSRVAEEPGPILDLNQRVSLAGPTGLAPLELNGQVDGLTVHETPLRLGQLLLLRLRRDPSKIVAADELVPRGVDRGAYHEYERAAFVDGGEVAAAVAERALGYEVKVTSTGVRVIGLAASSPTAGQLSVGDDITAVNGQRVTVGADLEHAVTAAGETPVVLTITSNGTTRDVVVRPQPLPGSTRPVLGVVIASDSPTVELPVPVTIDGSGVGGPSAGLMTALTVYDKLSPVDVVRGRQIAGTGTLALDGSVGPIGGIEAKARAADRAGADVFLAPAGQADAARAVLGDRMAVIAVTSFGQALTALQG